ncbi:MAG: L,D-transpeptidase family protein [Pseudobdellovibrionaceae bacterium]
MRLFLAGCVISFITLPTLAETVTVSAPEIADLPAPLLQISETDAFSKYVLLVDKEQRKLSVFERDGEKIKKVEEYPADIGKNGGNKTKRDDRKTPEGIYFLEKRLSQPEIPFSLYGTMAFTTNYPNLFDQRENKTGSGIWLHAIPDTVPLTRGSKGCVVVRNNVIKKLDDYIKLRETPILIFDQVNYISKEEHEKRRQELNNFIEEWRKAWENNDLDKYMTFYDKDFKAPGFKFETWKKHKADLKSKYDYVKVHLSQPYIVQHNKQLLIKTLQRYESNLHVDYGIKTIYALKSGNTYKIIREEWAPFNQKDVTAAIAREQAMVTPHTEAN